MRPPPVPAGKEELTQAQLQPQRLRPPQVNTLPPVKSEQKPSQAPPPPSGLLATLVPKNNSQPSAVPKPRPDPPTRPPPPCPVNKPLLVTHFCLLIYACSFCLLLVDFVNCHFCPSSDVFQMQEKQQTKGPQVPAPALQRGRVALAPSAGQKPNWYFVLEHFKSELLLEINSSLCFFPPLVFVGPKSSGRCWGRPPI